MRKFRRLFVAITVGSVLALTMTACGSEGSGGASTSDSGKTIIVGTTDKVISLDPAGSLDTGSDAIQYQVFRTVLGFAPGDPTPQPDAAEKCEFTDPKVYTCTIKKDLKFTNGNPLDANAVKFTFDRQLKIKDPNGPIILLTNLESVDAPNDTTVNFNLKSANDVTISQVLATTVGYIMDPKTISPDALTSADEIVAANAFSGAYKIKSMKLNETAELVPNEDYNGVHGKPKNSGVIMKYYTDPTNMRLDIAKGEIDVVSSPTMTPTDVEALETTDGVKVFGKPGGKIRILTFNLKTMPGDTAEQKLAVRKAIASLIDREKICAQVYKGSFTPLWSYVPEGIPGATTALKDIYGDKPNLEQAKKFLSDAGVKTPVSIPIQYNTDHYGASSADEYNEIKNELEASGLFEIELQSTEWGAYMKERVKDAYPVYQLGWTQNFPDADTFLSPLYDKDNSTSNNFESDEITALLDEERTTIDVQKRNGVLAEIQSSLAEKYLPTLPLLTGTQTIVARTNVSGVEETLDASLQFRFVTLSKS